MLDQVKKFWGLGAAVFLTLVLGAGLLLPGGAHAVVQIGLDDGLSGRGGGGEGDPVDGNDAGGGGTDDDLHSDLGGDFIQIFELPSLFGGTQVILLPDLRAGTVSFRILILESMHYPVEEIDVP